MLNSYRMQLSTIMKTKVFVFSCILVYLFVYANFFTNLFMNFGKDVLELSHPAMISLLSEYSMFGIYFMLSYPFLVILPSGFSLYMDVNSQEQMYIISKMGAKRYWYGKMAAVFSATFIVFFLPLMTEILLYIVSVPFKALGNPMNLSPYDAGYIEGLEKYYLVPGEIYVMSPYLYILIYIIRFSVWSGIFSCFINLISTWKIHNKLFLFIPCYVILMATALLKKEWSFFYIANYVEYFQAFSYVTEKNLLWPVIMGGMITFIVIRLSIMIKKDCLL